MGKIEVTVKTIIVLTVVILVWPQYLSGERTELDINRHYHDEITRIDGKSSTVRFDSAATTVTLEIRTRPTGRNKPSEWGVFWKSNGQRWDLEVATNSDWRDESIKPPQTTLTLRHNHKKIMESRVPENAVKEAGANSLVVEWDKSLTKVSFGSDYPELIFKTEQSFPDTLVNIHSFNPLDIEDLIVEEGLDPWLKAESGWDNTKINNYLQTSSKPEGIFEYLDRDNDPKHVRLGGRYTLALVRDSSNGYLLLYKEGAETNASKWRTGMVKGKLTPTRFKGQYNLVWYDSGFTDRGDEGYALIDDESNLLTINFPVLKATIRFVRTGR